MSNLSTRSTYSDVKRLTGTFALLNAWGETHSYSVTLNKGSIVSVTLPDNKYCDLDYINHCFESTEELGIVFAIANGVYELDEDPRVSRLEQEIEGL